MVALFVAGTGLNLSLLRVFYQAVLGLDLFSLRFLGLLLALNFAQILYIKLKY